MKINTREQAGFTIVEVLLAIALGVIVLELMFTFFSHGQLMFTKSQARADAQAELRLEMNQIKRELSVAIDDEPDFYVTIYANTPGTFDDGVYYLYVQNDTLILQEGNGTPAALPGCVSLPGLQITFNHSQLTDNVVRVYITCTEGTGLESDILLQNISGALAGDLTGNTIAFKRIS